MEIPKFNSVQLVLLLFDGLLPRLCHPDSRRQSDAV